MTRVRTVGVFATVVFARLVAHRLCTDYGLYARFCLPSVARADLDCCKEGSSLTYLRLCKQKKTAHVEALVQRQFQGTPASIVHDVVGSSSFIRPLLRLVTTARQLSAAQRSLVSISKATNTAVQWECV